jgi:hypothetical protein
MEFRKFAQFFSGETEEFIKIMAWENDLIENG